MEQKDGNRLNHVLEHLKDIPTRNVPHGYFSKLNTSGELIEFLDSEWLSISSKNWNSNLVEGASETIGNITRSVERNPANNSLQDVFIVNHGANEVGKLGGKNGTHASLYNVKVIVTKGTSEIITAYPI
jgi:hypothetical protein